MDIYIELKERLGEKLKQGELLAPYTNFKIGGLAEYFISVTNGEELGNAVKAAKDLELEYFILAGGTNVLINSQGVKGLTIKLDNKELEALPNHQAKVGAGVSLQELIEFTFENNLAGLEWAGGLPGSTGAAVYGNAGAYGGDTASHIVSVEAFDGENIVTYSKDEVRFEYRHSAFKGEKRGQIIVSATWQFEENQDVEASKVKVSEYISNRESKHPLNMPNAGCVFKNVKIKPGKLELLDPKQGDLRGDILHDCPPEYIERGTIPAAYLIELADLKGYTMGGIQVSPKHANFLVNLGKGDSNQFVMMVSYLKQQIRDEFGIQLREEVQLIGF